MGFLEPLLILEIFLGEKYVGKDKQSCISTLGKNFREGNGEREHS